MTDVELLIQHRRGSEAAFADLVRRHLGWVYGLARRRLRDDHQAEDVAQAVFVLLHRKAPEFVADSAMVSWLHRAAWYASETAARSERRRRNRETEAAMQQPRVVDSNDPDDWQQLAPVLDKLIERLSKSDREAILLRYYRDLSFAEVAGQIGTTAEAARKRVERAIEKLRRLAADQGVGMSVAALSAHLSNFVKLVPPPGLVATATVTATAPAGSAMAASCAGLVKGTAFMTTSAKITLAVVILVFVLMGSGIGVAVWMMSSGPTDASAQTQAAISKPAPTPAISSRASDLDHLWEAKNSYPKLAPFSAVAWHGDIPQVRINAAWYQLAEINGQPVAPMVNFAKRNSQGIAWQKHFAEDLVEILSRMGHPSGETVKLLLLTQDTSKPVPIEIVPMTAENRRSAMVFDNTGSLP